MQLMRPTPHMRLTRHTSKGESFATQVPELVSYIVVADVHEAPDFARQGVLYRELCTTAVAVRLHIRWLEVVAEAGVVSPLICRENNAI